MKAYAIILTGNMELQIKLVDEAGWTFVLVDRLSEPVIHAHMAFTGASYEQAKDEMTMSHGQFDELGAVTDRANAVCPSLFDGQQFSGDEIKKLMDFIALHGLDLQVYQFTGIKY